MKLTVVALYNSYLNCYDAPTFTNVPEEDLQESYRRSVLANPENAYGAHVHEKTVCILGTFDDVSGMISVLEQPKKLLDLASCFPPGFLAKRSGGVA